MSRASEKREAFFKRRVPLKWVFTLVAVLLVIMAAIVVALVLVNHRDEARRQAAADATSSTAVTSPYDFSELPDDTDLATLEQATIVSILIPDDNPPSSGMSADLPAAQALTEAIRNAHELGSDEAAALTAAFAGATTAGDVSTSTITFVFANRGTLTFFLDLDKGVVARGKRAWKPAGDLRALVEAATAGNQ